MTARASGGAAIGDPDFVTSLVPGRGPRLAPEDRVVGFMGELPAGAAFRSETEAFLAGTLIKHSLFGREVTGDP